MMPGSDDKPRIASMMLSSPPETPDLNEIIDYLKGQTILESGESVYEHVVKQAADQTALEANLRYYYWIEKTIELVKCDPDIGPPLPEGKTIWTSQKRARFISASISASISAAFSHKEWLSPYELAQHLKLPVKQILTLVRTKGPPTYRFDQNKGPLSNSRYFLRKNGTKEVFFKVDEFCQFLCQHPYLLFGLQKKKAKAQHRVEQNPNFQRAIDFAKRVKRKYRRIGMDDLAFVTHAVLTHGDQEFDDVLLERKYAGARAISRERFLGENKPAYSTVRNWFRRPGAFPHKTGQPSTRSR